MDDEEDEAGGGRGEGGAVALEDGVIKTFEDHEGGKSVMLRDS